MQTRKSKGSDLTFSVLGAGCWTFGGGEYWGEQSQKDVNDVVHAAVDLGINYFDTAEVYNEGRSESSLGEAIRGIARDKILIGSKVSPANAYPQELINHCYASLERLGTDYIDVYMLHWPIHAHSIRHFTEHQAVIDRPPRMEDALETLRKLRREGKIRHFGVSNFGTQLLRDLPPADIAVNELPYNLFCRAGEYDALSYCDSAGIAVISYMTLLQGVLGGGYQRLGDIPAALRRTRHFNAKHSEASRHGEPGVEEEINEALNRIRMISSESGLSMATLAIQWILQNPAITCSLVGSRNIRQLESNVAAAAAYLPPDIKEELDRISLPVKEKLGNHLDYYESAENDRTVVPQSSGR